MPRFFVDEVKEKFHVLSGNDAMHIIKSLRMKPGEEIILCSGDNFDYFCIIDKIVADEVHLAVKEKRPNISEPETKITLYQGIPKLDKMEIIVQKCVEIGVYKVVPLMTSRCVSRPNDRAMEKKIERWRKISKEAAKQSGRGIVPEVLEAINIKNICSLSDYDESIVFYECGGDRLSEILTSKPKSIAVFIGPEGGFEPGEIECLIGLGAKKVSFGPRILRTETAAIAAVTLALYQSGE